MPQLVEENMITVTPAAQRRIQEGQSRLRKREALAGYLFVLPNTVGFLLFFVLPIIASFVLSFVSWDLVQRPQWIGLSNYATLIHDSEFWIAVGNTIYYTCVSVPLSIVLSLLLAIGLN